MNEILIKLAGTFVASVIFYSILYYGLRYFEYRVEQRAKCRHMRSEERRVGKECRL